MTNNQVRILLAHKCCIKNNEDDYNSHLSMLRAAGYDVRGFSLSVHPAKFNPPIKEIEREWQCGDSYLLKNLGELEVALRECDVFINWDGCNLPLNFITRLPAHTVYVTDQNPEYAECEGRSTAWAYDQVFVRNIAGMDSYRDWGCANVTFLPLGFYPSDLYEGLKKETLNLHGRTTDLVLLGDNDSSTQRDRLDRLVRAFPSAVFIGPVWPACAASRTDVLAIYASAKIGINLHDLSGSFNCCLYQLPANGVMQVCDDKKKLQPVFAEGKEIIGYKTIGECIDLVKYYLKNEEERANIAKASFIRTHLEYNALTIWDRMMDCISDVMEHTESQRSKNFDMAQMLFASTRIPRSIRKLKNVIRPFVRISKQIIRRLPHPPDQHHDPWSDIKKPEAHAAILQEYYHPPIERTNHVTVRLGILMDFGEEYLNYQTACEELDVPYELINLTSDDWLRQIRRVACDGYIVHPTPYYTRWKDLFDERLHVLTVDLGKQVWPQLESLWIYESKRRMAYWLQAHQIPSPQTNIFYHYAEACDFLRRTRYPIVFKTNLGSGAFGVRVLRSLEEALDTLETAFGDGIRVQPTAQCDREFGYALFQEFIPNAREFRVIQVGKSWFAHEKLKQPGTDLHSGSGHVQWGFPPHNVLDFCLMISRVGHFETMDYDVLIGTDGHPLINELQVVFASYNPSQMYIDGKPGRYLHKDGNWKFEEGLYNRNGCANLRVLEFVTRLQIHHQR